MQANNYMAITNKLLIVDSLNYANSTANEKKSIIYSVCKEE